MSPPQRRALLLAADGVGLLAQAIRALAEGPVEEERPQAPELPTPQREHWTERHPKRPVSDADKAYAGKYLKQNGLPYRR